MKTIVDGLAVEYREEGQGDVLLLMHGWGDTLRTFDLIVPELSQKHRIVRLDLPGFGESERPHGTWGVGDYASFVQTFLNKIDVQPKAIIGHSFGGRIAIKGVANGVLSPERLVLIASAGNARRKTLKTYGFLAVAKVGKTIASILPERAQGALRAKLYEKAQSDYLHSGAMRDIFLKTIAEDLSGDAARITIPTLLIWGSEDRTTPLEDGVRFEQLIPGAQLEILEAAGHFVHKDASDEVATLIDTFV